MESPPPANQRTLLTHAMLVGLTPLIPIPFVDDLVKGYFQRRMVGALAASHGLTLESGELDVLATDRGGGCLKGCLTQVLVYPLTKIFRKIFYFLEWKRAVDLTSHTFHHGYLVDYALGQGWVGRARGGKHAADVRAAVDAVVREAPIRPVEEAVQAAFRQSRGLLRSIAGVFERGLRAAPRQDAEEVARTAEALEQREEPEMAPVVNRLQQTVGAIPESHFRRLRDQLAERLGLPAA